MNEDKFFSQAEENLVLKIIIIIGIYLSFFKFSKIPEKIKISERMNESNREQ